MLVTGGAGFIGSHVAEYFKDYEIVVLDNLSRAKSFNAISDSTYNWDYLGKMRNIHRVKADIRNFNDVKAHSKGMDVIIHTAGQVAVTNSVADPRTDFEINLLGTLNVLETARLNDSKVIFTSTNKVYGENVNNISLKEEKIRYTYADKRYIEGIPENFPIDNTGHSPYGCSKLGADIYTQDYSHIYGIKTGIFRQSCIYGERQFGVEDQGWVAWFLIATLTGKPLTIYGDGKQVRDVLYVKDLVNAFEKFVESNLAVGVFNMGGGPRNTLSLLELLDIINELTGIRPAVSFTDWRPSDQKVYVSNIAKAKKTLGWSPTVSPREGVGKVVQWVSSNLKFFT